MDKFNMLKIILEESLKENGNQELTVNHLLSMMERVEMAEEELCVQMNEFQSECLDPND